MIKRLTEPVVEENKSLYHYGVKGMKWGVRRNQGSGRISGKSSSKKKSPKTSSTPKKRTKKGKLRKYMSDLPTSTKVGGASAVLTSAASLAFGAAIATNPRAVINGAKAVDGFLKDGRYAFGYTDKR